MKLFFSNVPESYYFRSELSSPFDLWVATYLSPDQLAQYTVAQSITVPIGEWRVHGMLCAISNEHFWQKGKCRYTLHIRSSLLRLEKRTHVIHDTKLSAHEWIEQICCGASQRHPDARFVFKWHQRNRQSHQMLLRGASDELSLLHQLTQCEFDYYTDQHMSDVTVLTDDIQCSPAQRVLNADEKSTRQYHQKDLALNTRGCDWQLSSDVPIKRQRSRRKVLILEGAFTPCFAGIVDVQQYNQTTKMLLLKSVSSGVMRKGRWHHQSRFECVGVTAPRNKEQMAFDALPAWVTGATLLPDAISTQVTSHGRYGIKLPKRLLPESQPRYDALDVQATVTSSGGATHSSLQFGDALMGLRQCDKAYLIGLLANEQNDSPVNSTNAYQSIFCSHQGAEIAMHRVEGVNPYGKLSFMLKRHAYLSVGAYAHSPKSTYALHGCQMGSVRSAFVEAQASKLNIGAGVYQQCISHSQYAENMTVDEYQFRHENIPGRCTYSYQIKDSLIEESHHTPEIMTISSMPGTTTCYQRAHRGNVRTERPVTQHDVIRTKDYSASFEGRYLTRVVHGKSSTCFNADRSHIKCKDIKWQFCDANFEKNTFFIRAKTLNFWENSSQLRCQQHQEEITLKSLRANQQRTTGSAALFVDRFLM